MACNTDANQYREAYKKAMNICYLEKNKNKLYGYLPEPREEVNHDFDFSMFNVCSAQNPQVNNTRIRVPMNSAKNSLCYFTLKYKMIKEIYLYLLAS